MIQSRFIDTDKFSQNLRGRGIDLHHGKILMTNFLKSHQAEDLTLPPNCGGFGRIHHFKRSMGEGYSSNPLPIDPALEFLNLPAAQMLQVQVFQNAICSWRCWYCFVDFQLLSADPKHSEFKTVGELLDLYLQEETRPPIVDLSGGQPDLVPEWILWFADEIHKRGLGREIYLWSDDNLSNDYLWRFLKPEEIKRLSSYPNYGRVGCFKGYDHDSFSFNTQAKPELFDRQFELMRRLVNTGFDVYGYVTLTSSSDKDIVSKVENFIDRLQNEVHEIFPLRTIPLRIYEFTPTKNRMTAEHSRAMSIQQIAMAVWQEELTKRFSEDIRSKKIFDHNLSQR